MKGAEMASKQLALKQSAASMPSAAATASEESLLAEIAALRARLGAVLEQETEALYKASPGVPLEVCHALLSKGDGCLCRVVQRLMKDKEPALPAQ